MQVKMCFYKKMRNLCSATFVFEHSKNGKRGFSGISVAIKSLYDNLTDRSILILSLP